MKFTFQVRLDTAEREIREKLVIAANHGELLWHIALKLLGFLIFIEERPQIEEGVGWHYKPDLVSLDASGAVRLWVDCGNIAVRKIDRVATKVGPEGRLYILKRRESELKLLLRLMRGRVRRLDRVRLIAFEDGFVDALAAAIDATNDLSCRRRPDRISMRIANRRGTTDRSSVLYRHPS